MLYIMGPYNFGPFDAGLNNAGFKFRLIEMVLRVQEKRWLFKNMYFLFKMALITLAPLTLAFINADLGPAL